jgi:hypothetical protein
MMVVRFLKLRSAGWGGGCFQGDWMLADGIWFCCLAGQAEAAIGTADELSVATLLP